MKTGLFSAVTLLTGGMLFTAISCKNADVAADDTSTAKELRVSAPFANQTTQFAFDLAKNVSTQEGTSKNVFISPLSLHMALGMVLNGANGQTAQEIQKTLKLDAQTLAEANQTYQNLMENLPGVDAKVTLTLANSAWYRNTYPVATSYQDLLKQSFKADISAQDFNNPATVGLINNWASQKTNGKVPKVIERIDPDNVLFLLNALYFKGDWKSQFKPELTTDMPFKLASGGQATVKMMRQNMTMRRAYRTNYGAFELPYGSDKYAMTVLLPSENSNAEALLASFGETDWTQLQKDMTEGTVDFGLPKFTLEYEIQLNEVLKTMGMPTAFTNSADLSKISTATGLKLSFVKQNTFVTVDEKGTEAAAVTSVGVVTTSVPLPVLCNRPFVFVIHEKTSGTVLFVGKIANPTKTTN
ncbi:serpin family protein [Spirosoma daeguense]